jgi:hypothetical protein
LSARLASPANLPSFASGSPHLKSVDSFFHIDGDLHHQGLFNPAIAADGSLLLQGDARNRLGYGDPYAVVVTGDLSVDGNIVIASQNDSECALIVGGNLHCTNFCNSHECAAAILGDCVVEQVFALNYQDNATVLAGGLTARVVLSGAGDGWATFFDFGNGKAIRIEGVDTYVGVLDVASGEQIFPGKAEFADGRALLDETLIDDDMVANDLVRRFMLDGKPLLKQR